MAELPELMLGFVAETQRATCLELCGCMMQFGDCAFAQARLGERSTCERP
jgi:hypothetical protein